MRLAILGRSARDFRSVSVSFGVVFAVVFVWEVAAVVAEGVASVVVVAVAVTDVDVDDDGNDVVVVVDGCSVVEGEEEDVGGIVSVIVAARLSEGVTSAAEEGKG